MTTTAEKKTEKIRERLKGTNINETTLLATDYLNHFNEVVMMLEMVADMPELLDEVKAWEPKTYQEHFRDSVFTDKDLAIEAYEASPDKFRIPFNLVIRATFNCVRKLIEELNGAIAQDRDGEVLRNIIQDGTRTIGTFLDQAGAIIHGQEKRMAQADIDTVMGQEKTKDIESQDADGEKTSEQTDIDALFD